MDDDKRKVRLKSCKKELKRNKGPLLKPDVMLITKDVMVPLKLPPPPPSPEKFFPITRKVLKSKSEIQKVQRLGTRSLKPIFNPVVSNPEQNYIEESLMQMKKLTSEKKMGQETISKTPFHCIPGDNETQNGIHIGRTEDLALKKEDLNSESKLDLFHLDEKDKTNIEFEAISQVEKPLSSSCRTSMSNLTTSISETQTCSSNKSLDRIENELPKLPFSIISSSESEGIISAPVKFTSKYCPRIFVQNNDNQDVIQNSIQPNDVQNSEPYELKWKVDPLKNSNDESGSYPHLEINDWLQNSITEEESHASHDCDLKKLVINPKNELHQEDTAENNVEANSFEWHRIMIDVEYLLESLLNNLETLVDFNSFNNCEGNDNVEKISPQIFHNSDHNLNERIPTMIEFRHKSRLTPNDYNYPHDIELERKYSWQELNLPNSTLTEIENDEKRSKTIYNNADIKSNQSNEQIEAKYSWQIISATNQESNRVDYSKTKSITNEENSKLTSTEDLDLNALGIRYSWQKLTSKYLSGVNVGDNLREQDQLVRNTNNIPKSISNTEYLKDYLSLRETRMHSSNLIKNLKKEERFNPAQNVGKISANSPLNNIISSMLPEIKLTNRRNSFNDTTAEIIGNCRDRYLGSNHKNYCNRSSTPYSSVSSIKHVIANLNEMVTEQKHMLDVYVKNHKSDKNFEGKDPSLNSTVNRIEKVEIFPSTLHVLGNYIVRDIHPGDMNDQRNLLDSNNDENVNDYLLSDNSVRVKDVLDERIPAASTKPAVLNTELSIRSNNRIPQLPINITKVADLPSMLNPPMSLDSDDYSTIFTGDDNFSSKVQNLKKDESPGCIPEEYRNSLLSPVRGYDRKLIEKDWKPAIADMEEIIRQSQDAAPRIGEEKDDGNEAVVPRTKSTRPLKPRVQVSFSEAKEAGDSESRKEELLLRLEGAMSRLKQSEEHVDANWNLDYSVLDIEENISDKKVQLPKQVEEHIKDIIKSAEEYLAKLEEQLNDLRNADEQIINSSERTFKDIDETYQLFLDTLCQEIDKRRKLVRLETEVFKYEGLAPLRACKQEVDAQIRSTQHLIVLTENMLSHPVTFNKERLGKIITATSHMGRIPAVPMPEELPYVTFSPPNEEMRKEIVDRISCLGCVLRMGPAQFTEVYERPAGLQLKWHIVDPEYASEEQTFIVQKALGEITEPTSPAFETVYIGSENSCFVRDLPVDHQITLRVGIQVTDTAWSVHRIAQTSIPAYNWDMNNSDYLVTNGGRIATKVTQNLSTLLSRSPQFSANYIIEFKFLEATSGGDDEGIGLVFEPGGANETLKRNGGLLITPNGNIFMNGEQKLMQLPKMELGTRIVFTSEPKDEETLRMTIECANKAVTYDWIVQTPLHFAVRLSEHNKWNLMVK